MSSGTNAGALWALGMGFYSRCLVCSLAFNHKHFHTVSAERRTHSNSPPGEPHFHTCLSIRLMLGAQGYAVICWQGLVSFFCLPHPPPSPHTSFVGVASLLTSQRGSLIFVAKVIVGWIENSICISAFHFSHFQIQIRRQVNHIFTLAFRNS